MRKPAKLITAASAVAMVLGSMTLMPVQEAVAADMVEMGKKVAENRKKGNCFACHTYEGANMGGNIGPPLVAMKARFPNKEAMRAQIADPTKKNPDSMMPPFGKHNILTDKEIDAVTEWAWTL